MNILVGVNKEYLQPLGVMLYSLAVHNRVSIKLYIMHFAIPINIQKEFKKKIKDIGKVEVHFVKVDNKYFNRIVYETRYKMEANLRILLLKEFPACIDRILWLDTDIIVRGSIKELYTYPDYGQYAVVCKDTFPNRERYRVAAQIGLRMDEKYFNSGVMLFYLKNMRKDFGEYDFLRWMYNNPDKLMYPDQNTFNVCLKEKLQWVKPEIYNLQLSWLNDKKQYSKAISKCKIVHFNLSEKPWEDSYSGPGEVEYWRYGLKVLGIRKCLHHFIQKNKGLATANKR